MINMINHISGYLDNELREAHQRLTRNP